MFLKPSFAVFMTEVIFYLSCLIFSANVFEYLVSKNAAFEDIFSCGGYSSNTIYIWIIFIQLFYWVPAVLCSCADYYYDRLNILHLERIINPGYSPLKKVPWNDVIKACHWAISSSVISVVMLLWPFAPLIRSRGSCISITTYSATDYIVLFFVRMPLVYVVVDCLFYTCHRLCHIVPYLYQHIHKKHHEWKHTFGVQAIACHPLEHIGVNLFSVFGAPLIVGFPVELQYFFVAQASLNTVFAHCGYSNVVGRVLSGIPHDYHHHYWNSEFGTAGGLLDKYFQTKFKDVYPQVFRKLQRGNLVT